MKKNRHFKEFNEDGTIVCFYGGETSFSTESIIGTVWKYWELAE